ncbi:zinc finger CCCH domain-containing protein 3 [Teleopsis dalmanni]|uniref:zinc finger CCCH domain-containing protein 3 n=1 Tax=Teleopsis dalmanni TaxID=139649 RepID=UPI0018CF80C9|nr:zinc finger CCCH domain-containing protein 3 [Teleopsis dalmanni]
MLPDENSTPKRMIYVNPNFKDRISTNPAVPAKATHVNPLFLSTVIHMNPQFLPHIAEHWPVQAEQNSRDNTSAQYHNNIRSSATATATITASSNITPDQHFRETFPKPQNVCRKIIRKSRTTLVREPMVEKTSSSGSAHLPPLISLNRRTLVRCTPQKTYNINNYNPSTTISTLPIHRLNKVMPKQLNHNPLAVRKNYKLDNTIAKSLNICTSSPLPKTRHRCFVAKYAHRRAIQMKMKKPSFPRNSGILNASNSQNKKLQLININGVLYKSTQNKLQRKDLVFNHLENKSKSIPPDAKVSKKSPTSSRYLIIRGTKFKMDAKGHKLTRVNANDMIDKIPNDKFTNIKPRQRIDIGGLTYIASATRNTFIRTSNHITMAHVNSAKQRSVQQLTKRFVKNNVPCAIFQRIGKCVAHERGKCSKKHDKQQIIICPKFLRGECENDKCLLSHNISYSKMPVCKFYLQGTCVREKCPYLHKKLNSKTEICQDFLRGYCPLAEECKKRHIFTCPEFERNGECKTKECGYCKFRTNGHMKINRRPESTKPAPSSNGILKKKKPDQKPESITERYFCGGIKANEIENCAPTLLDVSSNDKNLVHVENADQQAKIIDLPSFIPL